MKSHVWPNLKRGLVAILRGVKKDEITAIGEVLIEAGFEAIEIPLNSPSPFDSIAMLARMAPENVWVGAGTVLTPEDVDRLHDAGGRLLVTPNVDPHGSGARGASPHGFDAGRADAHRSLARHQIRRVGAEVLPGQCAGSIRHLGGQSHIAARLCCRRGGRCFRDELWRLRQDRRAHIRPRLQPLQGWDSPQPKSNSGRLSRCRLMTRRSSEQRPNSR